MCRRKWLNYANFWSIKSFLRVLKEKTRIFFLTHHLNLIVFQNPLPSFPFLRMSLSLPFFQTIFVFLQLFHFHFIWYAFIFSIFSLYLQQSESILELFDLFVNHFSFLNGLSFFNFILRGTQKSYRWEWMFLERPLWVSLLFFFLQVSRLFLSQCQTNEASVWKLVVSATL